MKLKTPYKTVMFYGNILHVNSSANWVAVDRDGRLMAYAEKPHLINNVWDVESGAFWDLDDYVELEGEDWRNTLTYCSHDQEWMIESVAMLALAASIYVHESEDTAHNVIKFVAGHIKKNAIRAYDNKQQAYDAFLTHAISEFAHGSKVIAILRDELFPEQKEPEIRFVKDYNGTDSLVPSWKRWIVMKDAWSEAAFDMKEATSDNNLKLKNFRPLEMRQVEYFGEIITIPAHHKWVTTDDTGYVASWENEPDEQHGVWDYADDSGIEIPFFVGEFDPIDENDAIETLRHYPVEETRTPVGFG